MSETGDGLDHLRIPFEKIKFGKKLEVQGYGTVFEGEFDNQRVALKQLNITNLANIKPKLLAEILTISRFRQHPNLVALLGFCDEKNNEIILVYEYVASGNLADKMRKRLNTIQRFEICLGAARGLDYLHTGVDSISIVHGNVKLSKILLNSDSNTAKFVAKVSSFGLSKIVPGKAQKVLESMDEVAEKPTKMSDVYSFGVLLLEVLCGVSELVDTDDYQERHVSELVPKKMEQNKLRKVVHFDIRKEIKTEALEAYAGIACRCVAEDPEARPTMAEVVEELEKALRLQGGEVTYVQIPGSGNVAGAPAETVTEEGPKDDEKIPIIEDDAKDLVAGEKLNVAGEDNGDEIRIVRTVKDIATEEKSSHLPTLNSVDGDIVLDTTHSYNPETEEKFIDNLNSIEKSNVNGDNENENQDMKLATSSESSNSDTSTSDSSTNQEVLKSGSRDIDNTSYENYNEDELEHLRIPMENIKFGKKIDVHGYTSMFEGEFNHQQVALKQLNLTNLNNIKPKLLSAILTVSRFRKRPNLVSLIGFCDEKSNEIVLVYEYDSSGNLAAKMSKHLTTIQRLEICLGAARGLEYLHTGVESVDSKPGIIHGDIELSKILLNSNANSSKFEAKVSGYGLPKLLPGHVQINRKSIDPMYEVTGKLTMESDVYTFGVLLLEVLCGVPELIDTDDYHERHVTELVPKRLDQNMLRKIVHFDIRDEITNESLETYAKIACRCVMKNLEERPTMAEVVIELEKALKLQGGKIADVQISARNNNGLPEGTVDEDDQEKDDKPKEESKGGEVSCFEIPDTKNVAGAPNETVAEDVLKDDLKISTVDDEMKDLVAVNKLDVAGEDNVEELSIRGRGEDATREERSSHVPNLGSVNSESIPDKTCSSNNDPENTEEFIANLVSIDKSSNIGENGNENENDHQDSKAVTSSDTSTSDHSTNQEVLNSRILKSANSDFDDTSFENYNEDKLEHLRIPFDKIKFGENIDVRGYGSVFKGEFNEQQVVLKRLNITNLKNIKPKLLSAILTGSRFQQHPNLVALIGFCDEKSNEIILVYEHVSSGNLADKMSKHLTTIQRLEICLGAARGLEYLHTGVEFVDSKPGIIHGDIKLSKILLNSDANSSKFEAKVSGYGFPKLLPGHVQIARVSADPMYEVTGKLTKESDVYTFGVLLLEVLCGVPELVDTDDYHERHVTELVPKRLGQNMLRKIVHFDIRDEITNESLETYAKIACRCVMKNPEERPTMAEVVIELEKALRLQGGKVSAVEIFGSGNDNSLPNGSVDEDDKERVDNDEKMSPNITEEESKGGKVPNVETLGSINNTSSGTIDEDDQDRVDDDKKMSSNITDEESKVIKETIDDVDVVGQSIPVPILDGEDVESVPGINHIEDDKSKDNTNDLESTEEMTVNLKSNEESDKIGENEVDNDNMITTLSAESNPENSNSLAMQQAKGSENSDAMDEKTDVEDVKQETENNLKTSKDDLDNKVTTDDKITAMEITMEVHESAIQDSGNSDAGKHNLKTTLHNIHNTEKEPELIVNIREEDFSDLVTNNDNLISAEKTQGSESKRKVSTSSESSNGNDTTPSDYLLQKSPATTKKTSNSSANCYCGLCSCWRFFYDSVVFYGGLFWNKLVSCFTQITGQCSSKRD